MSKNITLSPNFGINPTVGVCFFCEKDTGEIAFCGRVRKGKCSDYKMPMRSVLSYEPCDKCREQFAKGALLIGVATRASDDRPAIAARKDGAHLYPTGDFVLIRPEAASQIAGEPMQAGQKIFIDSEALHKIIPNDSKESEA